MNWTKHLGFTLLILILSFFVWVPYTYAACQFGDATYCESDSWCGPTEKCGAGRCCQAKNSTCGNAAKPACNGWCAAGTTCTLQNGDCSCVVDENNGGGGCTSTPPQIVTLISPTDGSQRSNSSNTVTLSWNPTTDWGARCSGTIAKDYRVRVGRGTPSTIIQVAIIDDGSDSDDLPDQTWYNYTMPDLTPGTQYFWNINTYNGGALSGVSETWSFTLYRGVAGTVYVVPDGSTCSTSNPTNIGGALSATWDGTTTIRRVNTSTGQTLSSSTGTQSISSAVDPAGSFLVTPLTGTQCRNVAPQTQECTTYSSTGTLSVGTIPADYTCASSCGSCPRTSVNSNSSGNNFFYTQILNREGWWQAEGAGVYAGSAGGESIKSLLPTAASRLIISGGTSNSGALIKASNTAPNLGTNAGEVSNENWSVISKYRGKRADYAYFANQLGLTSSKTSDWGSSDELSKPVFDAAKPFYYMKPPSGTATISNPWTLVAPEKYVVFVDGDLHILSDITIPVGEFVAFIVKGKIIIDPAVNDIAGLFVTNQLFQTDHVATGDDAPLVTQGSVVTWGGVSLNRDLGPLNVTTPSEKFVWRPDLLMNMPDNMKSFALNWHEVAPGTFGN